MAPLNETRCTDDPKHRIAKIFNALAETYDTLRFVQVCARRLVERAALFPGAQVLDVATGTGLAALAAAQYVGQTGMVLGVDLSYDMLERGRKKVAAAGLTQVEFLAGDAERLNLRDRSFDVVLCASSLFFVPDILAALREWQRVLKPGGQVGFSGFGTTFRQPMLMLWEARLKKYGVPPPKRSPVLRLADPETCRRFLHEAGFVHIAVQSEQIGYYLQTLEECWEEAWASLDRLTVLSLAPDQREQFKAEHLAEVEALATEKGIWVDVPVNFAQGWKSST
ncbi:MAG: class I SAM-dependent methyltransferase [Thermodesulfobacteriota bacterium]|jgi:ubiquinone/menaquinone biosynthesis C-methylase UbiE|nr:MAG: class I SAM-dependent methyltransferase [Thermodesulfobacteriota bacterium]